MKRALRKHFGASRDPAHEGVVVIIIRLGGEDLLAGWQAKYSRALLMNFREHERAATQSAGASLSAA